MLKSQTNVLYSYAVPIPLSSLKIVLTKPYISAIKYKEQSKQIRFNPSQYKSKHNPYKQSEINPNYCEKTKTTQPKNQSAKAYLIKRHTCKIQDEKTKS